MTDSSISTTGFEFTPNKPRSGQLVVKNEEDQQMVFLEVDGELIKVGSVTLTRVRDGFQEPTEVLLKAFCKLR